MSSTPDESLLAAHDLARAALLEVTPESSIGEPAGYALEDGGVVSLRFANQLAGYPGWFWTVSVAQVEGSEPTVLEVELMPGETALLAPEWVPWAERLADYQAAQAALAEAEGDDTDDLDDDADDSDEDDLDDLDEDEDADDDLDDADPDEVTPVLHSGDLDGVDIDELDADAPDDEDEADLDEDELDDEAELDDESELDDEAERTP